MQINLGLNGQSAQALSSSNSENWSNSGSQNYGYSTGNSASQGSSEGYSYSWENVYGKEASAADILRAAEANQEQWAFQKAAEEYNRVEAQKAREFQEYMSNTAYQRAVIDLFKAGLNPILAAGSLGASTPVGAVASTGVSSAHKAQTFADKRAGSYSYQSSQNSSHSSSHSEESGSSGSSSYGYSKSQSVMNATNNVAGVAKTAVNAIKSLNTGKNANVMTKGMIQLIRDAVK